MSVVEVPSALLRETFDQFRACGRGERECVVYWIASGRDPHRVMRVVHPPHSAGDFGYEVESRFVNDLFLALRRSGETVRAQVHTHPFGASHSEVDDRYALAPAEGFCSLVVPDFALGEATLDRTHLVVMDPNGEWNVIDPGAHLVLV